MVPLAVAVIGSANGPLILAEPWTSRVASGAVVLIPTLAELPEPVLALLDFIAGLEEPRISRDQPDGLAEALNAQLPP